LRESDILISIDMTWVVRRVCVLDLGIGLFGTCLVGKAVMYCWHLSRSPWRMLAWGAPIAILGLMAYLIYADGLIPTLVFGLWFLSFWPIVGLVVFGVSSAIYFHKAELRDQRESYPWLIASIGCFLAILAQCFAMGRYSIRFDPF